MNIAKNQKGGKVKESSKVAKLCELFKVAIFYEYAQSQISGVFNHSLRMVSRQTNSVFNTDKLYSWNMT